MRYDRSWTHRNPDLGDSLITTTTLAIITTVSWLYHRQLTDALSKLSSSQKALQKERDQLEIKVEERTQELRETQLEQMSQLYRFVEMGRAAVSFFHDIRTPLSTVALNLEELTQNQSSAHQETADLAKTGLRQIEQYLAVAQRQLKREKHDTSFNVPSEITSVLTTFSQRCKASHISIHLKLPSKLTHRGDPIKFQHIMANLISNAYDALKNAPFPRDLTIAASTSPKTLTLTVHDTGLGIPAKQLKRIFEPFFTSKSDGFGLGLTLTKQLVQRDFKGQLHITSKPKSGTTCAVSLPRR